MTVFDDFEKIMTLALGQWFESEVVEDEQIGFGDLGKAPDERPITASNAQTLEQAGDLFIANGETLATSLMTESAGEP